jgi:hypothetical protein
MLPERVVKGLASGRIEPSSQQVLTARERKISSLFLRPLLLAIFGQSDLRPSLIGYLVAA